MITIHATQLFAEVFEELQLNEVEDLLYTHAEELSVLEQLIMRLMKFINKAVGTDIFN